MNNICKYFCDINSMNKEFFIVMNVMIVRKIDKVEKKKRLKRSRLW